MAINRAYPSTEIASQSSPDEAVHRIKTERTLKLTAVMIGIFAVVIAILFALSLQLRDVRTPGEPIQGGPSPTTPP
jgi:hypothetical protein